MKNNENIGLANDKYMQGVEKPENKVVPHRV